MKNEDHVKKTTLESMEKPEGTAQNGPQKMGNKRKTRRIVLLSVLGVVLVLMIAAGIYIYTAIQHPESLFTSVAPGQTKQPIENNAALSAQEPIAESAPKIVNILLLGIDQDYKPYASGGGDYHTDSIIVLAINFDESTVDMISLPRDTFTHVPGIRGIYKLNAAINCGGGKTETGFKKVCESASWMLGGVNIDYYFAFELDAVAEIGDMIGGVDFDVDMAYKGSSGTYYQKGQQHLDGTGIYDYMRARKNATGESGDKGRMNRGRDMLMAVFQKLKEQGMLTDVPQLISTLEEGTYTNLTLQQSIALANYAYENIDVDNIGSETMSGQIRSALGWDFCFIDQEHRTELIKKVYGIDVPAQQFVSYEYARWLDEYGFTTTRYLTTADEVMQYIEAAGIDALDTAQRESFDALKMAHQQTQTAYDTAALKLDSQYNSAMKTQREALRECTEELAKSIDYPGKLSWSVKSDWYKDPCINEVNVNFQ
jgi:LCP family protein required for cell wall assembly